MRTQVYFKLDKNSNPLSPLLFSLRYVSRISTDFIWERFCHSIPFHPFLKDKHLQHLPSFKPPLTAKASPIGINGQGSMSP
jgi:hypothetical protein